MTTYIKLKDVQNHYLTMLGNKYDLDGLNDIMELPSINPESLIEEMIEKKKEEIELIYVDETEVRRSILSTIDYLEILLQNFKS